MGWTVPRTWIAGEFVTDDLLNVHLRDNLLAAFPGGVTPASYAPVWTNVTVGNGTVTAQKLAVGNLEFFSIQLVFGSTTLVSGTIFVTLPATGDSTQIVSGTCTGADSSAGSFNTGIVRGSTTTIDLRNFNDPTGVWNATEPFPWASGDTLRIGGWHFKA